MSRTEGISGVRYEATVPDTLELAKRAALAVNGLTSTCDPEQHYLQYFFSWLNAQPPYMVHCGGDFNCTPKYAESLPIMRMLSGSTQNLEVDQGMLEHLFQRSISPTDGLYRVYYTPKRPWHSNRNARRISVRVLAWVNRSQLECTVNDQPRKLD